MNQKLTARQQEILEFIKNFSQINGFPPTLREIGKEFNIVSTFGVKRHLDALQKKGFLNVEVNTSRGITVNRLFPIADFEKEITASREIPAAYIPLIGRVAAGSPILAQENVEGSIMIDAQFLKKADNCFALKVRGDSMIEVGINDGDLVIVSPQSFASNGEIIVARIEDEVTVKVYEKRNDKVVLIPKNKNYSPILVKNPEDFSLVGKVMGVLRWYN